MDYEERLVAFIDILGFKEIVKLSEGGNDSISFIAEILSFLKTKEHPQEWTLDLIEIEECAQRNILNSFDISDDISCTCFSDSLVVSVGLNNRDINKAASTLIANLSLIGAELLAKGILIRGAITIGSLIHNDGYIVGQALIDAYELEAKIAKNPRIVLSDKLINKLKYPLKSKVDLYPYHYYIKRFDDGSAGFHQITYFEVVQNSTNIPDDHVSIQLDKIRKVIIKGLDCSFEKPEVYNKYLWLKHRYDELYIYDEGVKKKIYGINEGVRGGNIQYKYTEDFYNRKD